ncbi:hypothetical protein RI129_000168 [Pyrocoelia pectoralis]|uniref:Ku domain-containing protein n=1 Tax=Pyrocoelia pectoralis TaxID=417401 RepID=A0AAN7ZEE2_9COLE
MPPTSKKNVSVILFDVNCEENFQEAANKCLMNIWSTKWFSGSKDCTKLILLNTAETNIENSKFSKARHMSEVTSVISYMPKILHQHLEGKNKRLLTSLNVFKLIIKNSLENLNCFLYVLGPKVKVPMHMTSFEDIKEWSKKVEFIDGDTPSLAVVKEIVEATTYSVVCDLELGEQLFSNYQIRGVFKRGLHLSNDVNAEVTYDNVVGGVFRHGKFVPLTKDVENNFKSQEARCFNIIGFTDQRNVSEQFEKFRTIITHSRKRKLCAIAKRIYLANCRPKLYAMFPNEKDDVFIATPLPSEIIDVYDYLNKLDLRIRKTSTSTDLLDSINGNYYESNSF